MFENKKSKKNYISISSLYIFKIVELKKLL